MLHFYNIKFTLECKYGFAGYKKKYFFLIFIFQIFI